MEESESSDNSLIEEAKNRKYVTEETYNAFYEKLHIRRNDHMLLQNQLDKLIQNFQLEVQTKKKLKLKLKESQENYTYAYSKLKKSQNTIQPPEIYNQTREETMKKETLFKEIEALKKEISGQEKQLEEETTKYNLQIQMAKENYSQLEEKLRILSAHIQIVNQDNGEQQNTNKQQLRPWDLFPIPNTYQRTKSKR